LLEIGCASGTFLAEMESKGWAVQGIEFSEMAAARARAQGFDVQTGSVESAIPPQAPVDLVAAWMVLEHLHDPLAALVRLRSWLNPNGWLVASVPDAGSWQLSAFGSRWYDLHLPNHLYHFTPATLSTLFERAGWALVRVVWLPNANSFLSSLAYVATEANLPRLARMAHWFKGSKSTGRLRVALGGLLRATRQSGRMVVWARPAAHR
jgi:SAM-dependent methyltransferase